MRGGLVAAFVVGISVVAAPAGRVVAAQSPNAAPDLVASVWYRGVPAGVPRQDDLAAIRAAGFTAVTWPMGGEPSVDVMRPLAASVGLRVIAGRPERPLTPLSSLRPTHDVTIATGTPDGQRPTALAWRAILHGARVVSFDGGSAEGAGMTGEDGQARAWVAEAAAVARQLTFNHQLIEALYPGPDVIVLSPRPAGLDVVLMQTRQVWVLGATNVSSADAHAVAQLPKGVPTALWTDVLDGSGMSMLPTPEGARWTFDLAAGAARLYAIDKTPGSASAPFRSPR
jgi:hypothetical protein